MDFALKILYYATQTIACLMVGFFFPGCGIWRHRSQPDRYARQRTAFVCGAGRFGVISGTFAIAGWPVLLSQRWEDRVFVAMILGSLLFTNVHWQ